MSFGKMADALNEGLLANTALGEILKMHPADAAVRAWTEFVSDTTKFAHAIDWDEPFIIALLSAHVLLFLWIVYVRKSQTRLVQTFVAIAIMVLAGEQLNMLAAKHYRRFSKQNYFDKSGTFIVTVYALPLVLNLVVTLAALLGHTCHLMVVTKRAQLRRRGTVPRKAPAANADAPPSSKK